MDLQKKSHEKATIKHSPGIKHVLSMVQQAQYFVSKSLNGPSKKSHMKLSPSNMLLV